MNGLLINSRGLAVSGRALVATSGEAPCCCSVSGTCCDTARRLRVCPDGVSEYCCACGSDLRFSVYFKREMVIEVLRWGETCPPGYDVERGCGVPGDRFDENNRYPPPPNRIFFRWLEEYQLTGEVRCINGVRTVQWLLPTFYRRQNQYWDGAAAQYVEFAGVRNVYLTDPAAIDREVLNRQGDISRWCGTNFSDWQKGGGGMSVAAVDAYAPNFWTHCDGGNQFLVARTPGRYFLFRSNDASIELIRGRHDYVGEVRCNGGEFFEAGSGNYLHSDRVNAPYAKESSTTEARWSITPLVPCATDPCEPVPTGACCRQSSGGIIFGGGPIDPCLVVSRQTCNNLAGFYAGDGTTCAFANCLPLGPCCIQGIGCLETTQPQCLVRSGVWHGAGNRCDQSTCAGPVGPCCLNGVCLVTSKGTCLAAGGDYKGDGLPCMSSTCIPEPPKFHPCCLPDGTCQSTTQAACVAKGGAWRVDAASCALANCRPVIIVPPRNDQPPINPAALGGGCSSCGGEGAF